MSAALDAAVTVTQRRVPRHLVSIPLDVTVLRSGIPDLIPARALDVSEGGICAVVAGTLQPGDSVGVEFRLPDVGLPIRAKAVIRHEQWLRCGIEFVALAEESRAMIQYWARRKADVGLYTVAPRAATINKKPGRDSWRRGFSVRAASRLIWATVAVFTVIGLMGAWRWYGAWHELESHSPQTVGSAASTPQTVPPALMGQLLTYRLDPVYPKAARRARLWGTVVLDTDIAADGTVTSVSPVSGPPVLATAAMDAVRMWRFQPYRVKGKPAEVKTLVAVDFRP